MSRKSSGARKLTELQKRSSSAASARSFGRTSTLWSMCGGSATLGLLSDLGEGLDRDFLRSVAQIRAVTRAKTPDAIQLAAAVAAGCRVFLTNDNRIPPLPGLRRLLLEDYLPRPGG
jgi:hypothetical protein